MVPSSPMPGSWHPALAPFGVTGGDVVVPVVPATAPFVPVAAPRRVPAGGGGVRAGRPCWLPALCWGLWGAVGARGLQLLVCSGCASSCARARGSSVPVPPPCCLLGRRDGDTGHRESAKGQTPFSSCPLTPPISRWHRGRWGLPRARVPLCCCTGALVWLEGDFKPSIRGFNPRGAFHPRHSEQPQHGPTSPAPSLSPTHPPTTPSRPSHDRGPPPCPCPAADSKWGPWNHWSLCSKTCDTGWQRRFRMCEGTGVQGYPCEGTGEEVKTCNEKKCPGTGQPPAPSPGARAAPDPPRLAPQPTTRCARTSTSC